MDRVGYEVHWPYLHITQPLLAFSLVDLLRVAAELVWLSICTAKRDARHMRVTNTESQKNESQTKCDRLRFRSDYSTVVSATAL
jgi:hypothetical protein